MKHFYSVSLGYLGNFSNDDGDCMQREREKRKRRNNQAPVVQRPDNFIRWIRHFAVSKIYFTFNVVQGFPSLPNLTVVRVCIFAFTRGKTEIFSQIETVG